MASTSHVNLTYRPQIPTPPARKEKHHEHQESPSQEYLG